MKDQGTFIVFAFLFSLALALINAFVDEGIYSFGFLLNPNDVAFILIFSAVFALLPIVLYFLAYVFFKRKNISVMVGSLGFLPAILLIIVSLAY
jgi:hypothetical protein